MKSAVLLGLSFIGIIISPICNCLGNESFTMVYAVGKTIFTREFGKHETPKELKTLNQKVSALAINNNFIYATIQHGDHPMYESSHFMEAAFEETITESVQKEQSVSSRNGAIWRAKVTSQSPSFKVDNSSWETFQYEDSDSEILLGMAIVEGKVYAGGSRGMLWECSTNEKVSCSSHHKFDELPAITDIEYNPHDGQLYAVEKTYTPDQERNWYHRYELVRCSPETNQSCTHTFIGLQGESSLHIAFDALWITDAGRIRKCLCNKSDKNFRIIDEDCSTFHNFNNNKNINIGASSKHLYAHMGSQIWSCDPHRANSCFEAEEPFDAKDMGPFIII